MFMEYMLVVRVQSGSLRDNYVARLDEQNLHIIVSSCYYKNR